MSKHQGGDNPQGYICPKRRGKRTVQTYLEPQLYEAMQEIASQRGLRLGDALHLACREFAKRHSNEYKDAPASYDPPPCPSPAPTPAERTAELVRLAQETTRPTLAPKPRADSDAGNAASVLVHIAPTGAR